MNEISKEVLNRQIALDPTKYRPKWYPLLIECGAEIDDRQEASVNISNDPFMLDKITHQIIGVQGNTVLGTIGQDGQYLFSWKDDQNTYMSEPGMADCLFGSVRSGFFIPLPVRVIYQSSKTLTGTLQNLIDRTDIAPKFKVMFHFHGFEQW